MMIKAKQKKQQRKPPFEIVVGSTPEFNIYYIRFSNIEFTTNILQHFEERWNQKKKTFILICLAKQIPVFYSVSQSLFDVEKFNFK